MNPQPIEPLGCELASGALPQLRSGRFSPARAGNLTVAGEVVTIGRATDFNSLSRWQRSRLRKKGVDVPRKPMPSGYKQSAEHIEKRKRKGPASHRWLGDDVNPKLGRKRALKMYREIGPCIECGAAKTERHHRDENPANNAPENIAVLCRSCHMKEHARLRREKGAICERK